MTLNNRGRRLLIKNSLLISGLVSSIPARAMGISTSNNSEEVNNSKRYKLSGLARSKEDQVNNLMRILRKYTTSAKTINDDDLKEFCTRFIDMNGIKDYRKEFSGISGEYRLAKLLIQSVHAST